MYMSVAELVTAAKETKKPIYELMIEQEMETSQTSREEIWHTMGRNLDVMEAAVNGFCITALTSLFFYNVMT
ncbi:hypothetical protein WP50_05265 [Lactiplantibacillus plantarum]|nr:hypothetical protein WP50_05265 [Lactiplantibacillus plantarum]